MIGTGEFGDDDEAREAIKWAYFERLYQEGRIWSYRGVQSAVEEIEKVVDNLVSVDDGVSVIFYGIDGEPNDPSNVAAQFFHGDEGIPVWVSMGDGEE